MHDLHTALRSEEVSKASSGGVNFLLSRLQWSREHIGFALHAEPASFSTAGVQTTDFLSYLGFQRSECTFFSGRGCYVATAPETLDVSEFAKAFAVSFGKLEDAERHLNRCGYSLDQPEGWAFFGVGSRGGRDYPSRRHPRGDGHRSPASKEMKRCEDEHFNYIMSWIEGGSDKGWVFHYGPKHPPLSAEALAALQFLAIQRFPECPFFDFTECHYRFYPFVSTEDRFFDSNAQQAHSAFDQHPSDFSSGVRLLAEVHGIVAPFGYSLLPQVPIPPTSTSLPSPPKTLATEPSTPLKIPGQFDVAMSFAGTERQLALHLATRVRDAGYSVFYDDFYPEQLWGKDLVALFDDIYRKQSRFCVIFISAEYCTRMWTNHERMSAQAKALGMRGQEYILPIKVDDSELPGLQPTIGYVSLENVPIDEVAELLLRKLSTVK